MDKYESLIQKEETGQIDLLQIQLSQFILCKFKDCMIIFLYNYFITWWHLLIPRTIRTKRNTVLWQFKKWKQQQDVLFSNSCSSTFMLSKLKNFHNSVLTWILSLRSLEDYFCRENLFSVNLISQFANKMHELSIPS